MHLDKKKKVSHSFQTERKVRKWANHQNVEKLSNKIMESHHAFPIDLYLNSGFHLEKPEKTLVASIP